MLCMHLEFHKILVTSNVAEEVLATQHVSAPRSWLGISSY
jgi:hypothetical protein